MVLVSILSRDWAGGEGGSQTRQSNILTGVSTKYGLKGKVIGRDASENQNSVRRRGEQTRLLRWPVLFVNMTASGIN